MILENKVAIITGASGGVAGGIASVYAREGCRLVLSDADLPGLGGAQRELAKHHSPVEAFRTDVTREAEVRDLVAFTLKTFGTVDILVNCAGIYGPIGPAVEVDTEGWLKTIGINLGGTFICMKNVLPTMIKNRKGKIVNMSGGGAASPFPRFTAYGTSKAGVVRLTETLAQEVLEHGIDINAIAPGGVNTRMLNQVLEAGETAVGSEFYAKSVRQQQEGGVPPLQIGELALFLASSESDGLSGKLVSLLWDDWKGIPERLEKVMSSDIYAMRRIVPSDRGYDW